MGTPVAWSRIDERFDKVLIVAAGPSAEKIPLRFYGECASAGVRIIGLSNVLDWLPVCHDWITVDPAGIRTRVALRDMVPGVRYWCAVPENLGSFLSDRRIHRRHPQEGVRYLKRLNRPGHPLAEDPGCIETGNSAYGALGMAHHYRAKIVGIVGLDGTRARLAFCGPTVKPTGQLTHLPALFSGAMPQLRSRVFNLSQHSNIGCLESVNYSRFLELVIYNDDSENGVDGSGHRNHNPAEHGKPPQPSR